MIISDKHVKRIEQCFDLAKENETTGRARLCASIYVNNRLLSVGYNHKKSSPFQAKYAKNEDAIFFHAETHAIKNFIRDLPPERLKDSTLYIARAITDPFKRKWETANAFPCIGCLRAIHDFEIPTIFATNENGGISEYTMEDIESALLENINENS